MTDNFDLEVITFVKKCFKNILERTLSFAETDENEINSKMTDRIAVSVITKIISKDLKDNNIKSDNRNIKYCVREEFSKLTDYEQLILKNGTYHHFQNIVSKKEKRNSIKEKNKLIVDLNSIIQNLNDEIYDLKEKNKKLRQKNDEFIKYIEKTSTDIEILEAKLNSYLVENNKLKNVNRDISMENIRLENKKWYKTVFNKKSW